MKLLEELKAKFRGVPDEEKHQDAQADAPATESVLDEEDEREVEDVQVETAEARVPECRITITYFGGPRPEIEIENFQRLTTTRLSLLPQLIWREAQRSRAAAIYTKKAEEAQQLKEAQDV